MRITAELINDAPSHINAIKEYELDLRGHKIPKIENLAVSRNQHDAIDLCDNDIRYLGNFPSMPRLQRLYLANNRITLIDDKSYQWIPNLKTLILNNNEIKELVSLDPLRNFRALEQLSIVNNPVTKRKYARLWVIWRLPQLRNLNYQRVKQKEREEAKSLFETKDGELTSLAKSILQVEDSNTFEPGEGIPSSGNGEEATGSRMDEDGDDDVRKQIEQENAALREQIQKSADLQDVGNLETLMRQGYVPGELANRAKEGSA